MRKIISAPFLFFVLFTGFTSYCQNKTTVHDTVINCLPVSLIDEDDIIVILFENDTLFITTTYKLFSEEYNNILSTPEDAMLISKVAGDNKKGTIVNAVKIAAGLNCPERLNVRFAWLLQNGKCFINSRKNRIFLNQIKMQTWEYTCGKSCGNGGRRFFAGDYKFFSVTDWVKDNMK